MENSRWACPKCGSKDVEIALPMWCREDDAGNLSPCHLDEEADPIFWLCNTCEASDKGRIIPLIDPATMSRVTGRPTHVRIVVEARMKPMIQKR